MESNKVDKNLLIPNLLYNLISYQNLVNFY